MMLERAKKDFQIIFTKNNCSNHLSLYIEVFVNLILSSNVSTKGKKNLPPDIIIVEEWDKSLKIIQRQK